MAEAHKEWKPNWWNDEHMSAWDRVKEALRRDWEQTKHDLSKKAGHEMNQGVGDTVKQATGAEPVPPPDVANPPKVIGDADWSRVEEPMRYGYGARSQYGKESPTWTDAVETRLKSEWETDKAKGRAIWDDVRPHVRRGYEYTKR